MPDEVIEAVEVVASHPVLYPADPADMVALATRQANVLTEAIQQQKLFADIHGKKHILVGGWTLLGAMVGVFPVTEWSRPIEVTRNGKDDYGWEARVIARHLASGETVGAAEAMCMAGEAVDRNKTKFWGDRGEFAMRSMAETRARSKALRAPLEFIVQIAGFMSTPAEEMPAPDQVTDAQLAQLEDWRQRIAALPDAEKRREVSAMVKALTDGKSLRRLSEDVADRVLDQLERREEWFVAVEAGRDPEAESEPF